MTLRGTLVALCISVAACSKAEPPAPAQAEQESTVSVARPWARETAEGQDNGGVFLTLTGSGVDDRLLSASTPAAATVQIHETTMDSGVMRMREKADGLAILAGEAVTLAPGGIHLMLVGLKDPLERGSSVPLTLTFEKAGEVTVTVPVVPVTAEGPGDNG